MVYISRCVDPNPPYTVLRVIRSVAEPANVGGGLRSAISLQDGWFLHWMEADQEQTARETFHHIQRDRRHTDIQVLFEGLAFRSAIDSWSMSIVTGGDSPIEMVARAFRCGERATRGEFRNPLAAWRAFSSEITGTNPAAVRRVWTVSTTTGLAQDVVSAWATDHRTRLATSRLMGSLALTTDFSGCGADVQYSGGVLSMIGVARRALSLGLVHELMRDADAVVVPSLGYVSSDMDSLLQAIARVGAGVSRPPPVLLCGDPTAEAEMAQTLNHSKALGLDAHWAPVRMQPHNETAEDVVTALARLWRERVDDTERAMRTTQPIRIAPPSAPGVDVPGVQLAVAVNLTTEDVLGPYFGAQARKAGDPEVEETARRIVRDVGSFSRALQGHETLIQAGKQSRMLRLSPWGGTGCGVVFDHNQTDINQLRRSVSAYLAWLEMRARREPRDS